jgi:hypothetical protein
MKYAPKETDNAENIGQGQANLTAVASRQLNERFIVLTPWANVIKHFCP